MFTKGISFSPKVVFPEMYNHRIFVIGDYERHGQPGRYAHGFYDYAQQNPKRAYQMLARDIYRRYYAFEHHIARGMSADEFVKEFLLFAEQQVHDNTLDEKDAKILMIFLRTFVYTHRQARQNPRLVLQDILFYIPRRIKQKLLKTARAIVDRQKSKPQWEPREKDYYLVEEMFEMIVA
jgi:hypothetical protein